MPRSLSPRDRRLLAILAGGSMIAAYVNTLFTQTVAYAADEFGVSNSGQGVAAAIVRWGIVFGFPFVLLADRRGRRGVIIVLAWVAPIVSALGALAPNFPTLVATQTLGRPLGITLEVLIAVVCIEEMPRTARAFATGALSVAAGAGAGVAVGSLPIADAGEGAWRVIYAVGLVWCVVAALITRHLPETRRFTAHAEAPPRRHPMVGRRLAPIAAVAFTSNMFVASASIFQNRYLKEDRGYSALLVAVFTTVTSVPAMAGLLGGGRIADLAGRRLLATTTIPLGALCLAGSFATSGAPMWGLAIAGGLAFGAAYPATAVYRGELFPTGRRGLAGALVTASALAGGSIGLLAAGPMIDSGLGYGATMLLLAIAPVAASVIIWFAYPETANLELEEINPGDQRATNQDATTSATSSSAPDRS
jgi:MFS family permease